MKTSAWMLALGFFAMGCSSDSTGAGTQTVPPNTSGSGGTAIVGDAFPEGAVGHFRKIACPTDWEFFPAAHGRVIIAASEGLPRGTLLGEPLQKGEDREHTHNLSTMVEVPTTEIAGIEGGGNDGMTPAGTYAFTAISSSVAADIPYLRLLTCKKNAPPAANALPLPAKLHSYFDLDVCPSGWKPAVVAQGRLIVGRPADAPADLPFGGASITSTEMPTHSHTFESSFATNPHGVALASGCCGKFGQNGTVMVAGETEATSVDIPMISLLHCEKE